ncbi:MAG: 2-hydroxyacyl-CoA dehydratase [Syntrophomonadaceae bacterium]|nr:2-hydroxyacyl-CoA dehydratase [Syntrophomonadaceae bacterium]
MTDQTPKTAKDLVREMQAQYYEEANRAHDEGRLVAWVTSISPREFLEAMDIVTVYPENHAAAISAKKGSMEMIDIAEGMGYSADICSYARVNLGYLEKGDSAAGRIPAPDLLFCANNICDTVTKWYEILARRLKVPLIMIDLPFSFTPETQKHHLDYVTDQFKEAIRQLEDITGKPFDYERFQESMRLSNEAASLWRECIEMGKAVPCPFNGLDFFNYMAQIVCSRGNEKAVQFFRVLRDELAAKVARGEGFLNNEKYRILWDGIPFWYNLRVMSKTLLNNNAVMAASTYPDNWAVNYDPNDLKSMARAYMGNFTNREFSFRYHNMCRMIDEYTVDGVIMHSNRSCKNQDFAQYALAREVTKATRVPVVIVDGDQSDPRAFSEAQFETRVQALFEMIGQNRRGNVAARR